MTERDIRRVLDWADERVGPYRPRRINGSLQRRVMHALLSNIRPLSILDIGDQIWRSDTSVGTLATIRSTMTVLRSRMRGSGFHITNLYNRGYVLERE